MTLGCHKGAFGRLSVTTPPPPPQWASHLRAASEKKCLTVVCSVFAALLVILLLYRSVCFPAVCNDSPYVKPLDKKDECVEAHQQRECGLVGETRKRDNSSTMDENTPLAMNQSPTKRSTGVSSPFKRVCALFHFLKAL